MFRCLLPALLWLPQRCPHLDPPFLPLHHLSFLCFLRVAVLVPSAFPESLSAPVAPSILAGLPSLLSCSLASPARAPSALSPHGLPHPNQLPTDTGPLRHRGLASPCSLIVPPAQLRPCPLAPASPACASPACCSSCPAETPAAGGPVCPLLCWCPLFFLLPLTPAGSCSPPPARDA